jgi:hypothetical protein
LPPEPFDRPITGWYREDDDVRLCIFGRHPIPQGGFNGVMSLFEAIGFSRLGYETSLLLPFADPDALHAFLDKHKLSSLDELPRFGGRFAIEAVYPDETTFPKCDVLVYQSYAGEDWERFGRLCRKSARLLTKNFPKFVAGPAIDPSVRHQLETFDLLACALMEDVLLLQSIPEVLRDFPTSVAYVPRGASPEMLHAGYKFGLPPTLGFDVPNKPAIEPLQHFVEPVRRLRRDYPSLQIISIGREVPELGTRRVPFGRFDRIYDEFFNRVHLYCTINYAHSPDHTTASVQQRAPGWKARAIYEVQNIEAQMSGAVLVGHRDNLVSELYIPGVTGLNFIDFSDEAAIYLTLKHGLERWSAMAGGIREFAATRFDWFHCIKLWSDALQARLKAT